MRMMSVKTGTCSISGLTDKSNETILKCKIQKFRTIYYMRMMYVKTGICSISGLTDKVTKLL